MKSIFDLNPYESLVSKADLKNSILLFFKSDKTIFEIFVVQGWHTSQPQALVNASCFIEWCIQSKMKLPIDKNIFDKLTLEQLIEIFRNIDKNFQYFLKEYILEEGESWEYYENTKVLNKSLSNSLVIYCKENNITWKKYRDIFVKMHFNQEVVVANNNKDINFAYDEYRKIRDSQDENSLKTKLTILSGLKNHMDHWISLRQNNNGKKISLDFQDKFFELKTNIIIDYMHSLASHISQKSNIKKFEDIKTSFKQATVKEKHAICDSLLDSIIFMQYKVNLK